MALRVAIVGSGPSAFYSAARLLSQNATANVEVHMYERLPTPHGLVRYGVAPDHPEVKNVENKFAQIATDERFRFFGNVNIIGSQSLSRSQQQASSSYTYPLAIKLPFSSLLSHYTHVLLSYGSSLSRPLGIPGSIPGELFNIHAALDFVNWYNGHPAAHDQEYIASQPWKQISLNGLQHATVVGAGNVALDVARILLRSTSTLDNLFKKDNQMKSRAALNETDIPEIVLEQLSKCQINHVDIVARRGPAQVAFTNKELREIMNLQNVHYQGIKLEDMNLAKNQIISMEEKEETFQNIAEIRVRKRLLGILEKGSKSQKQESVAAWSTSFFQNPRQFLGEDKVVKQIEWDEMKFQGLPASDEQSQPWNASSAASTSGHQLVKTGQIKKSSTDLVITSVGYQGAPLDGSDPIQTASGIIAWDAKKGIIPNRGGRVMSDQGKPIPGLYVSGWLASGPIGVIASTRIDANSVVDQLLQDWHQSPESNSLTISPQPGEPDLLRQSTQPVISWSDWLRLDAEELRRGKEAGKSREKILSVREMLDIIA